MPKTERNETAKKPRHTEQLRKIFDFPTVKEEPVLVSKSYKLGGHIVLKISRWGPESYKGRGVYGVAIWEYPENQEEERVRGRYFALPYIDITIGEKGLESLRFAPFGNTELTFGDQNARLNESIKIAPKSEKNSETDSSLHVRLSAVRQHEEGFAALAEPLADWLEEVVEKKELVDFSIKISPASPEFK